ncbi:hypothetical protein RB195_017673 [Necator americanus]|uniref:Uncharacterized protein n=1 Tax=Necator americanus TaxID=51031 RepID=A0ABR1C9D7_NECAM
MSIEDQEQTSSMLLTLEPKLLLVIRADGSGTTSCSLSKQSRNAPKQRRATRKKPVHFIAENQLCVCASYGWRRQRHVLRINAPIRPYEVREVFRDASLSPARICPMPQPSPSPSPPPPLLLLLRR